MIIMESLRSSPLQLDRSKDTPFMPLPGMFLGSRLHDLRALRQGNSQCESQRDPKDTAPQLVRSRVTSHAFREL